MALAVLLVCAGCGRSGAPDGDVSADGDRESDREQTVRPAPADCLRDPECRRVMVAAHRGHHAVHPENSIAGLRSAARLGCDFVEVDVRHTADGALVLMHDGTVDRTTDGSGSVDAMTAVEIAALTLSSGVAGDPESVSVPLFSAALAAAREEGVMLYVDQKTGRTDLVLAAIRQGEFYDQALVRDGMASLASMVAADDRLLAMPPVADDGELAAAIGLLPGLRIVEIGLPGANPDLVAAAGAAGLMTQQDVMAGGDLQAGLTGNYTGWKGFVDASVRLLQTDLPELLLPAVEEYNRTGLFPDSGPATGFR